MNTRSENLEILKQRQRQYRRANSRVNGQVSWKTLEYTRKLDSQVGEMEELENIRQELRA